MAKDQSDSNNIHTKNQLTIKQQAILNLAYYYTRPSKFKARRKTDFSGVSPQFRADNLTYRNPKSLNSTQTRLSSA